MTKHFTRGKYRDEDRVIDPCLSVIEKAYEGGRGERWTRASAEDGLRRRRSR